MRAPPEPAAFPLPTIRSDHVAAWDGIRALSVSAVIAFHFWPEAVEGGFLGVTTFLVLAGTLAVVRIHRETARTGDFDWRRYFAGRARRVLPALILYTAVALVWIWSTRPEIYREAAADATAALLQVTPWREMTRSVTYESAFEGTAAPFVHTWSLGVEELAWILTGIGVALVRRPWIAAVSTLVLGGVAYAVWFGEPDLYYSPARLAEFGLGAAAGLVLIRTRVRLPWPVGAAAIAVGAWCCATWSVPQVYSGRLTAAATLAALLVVSSVEGPIGRLLSWAPLRWVGTRSYALYLWHVGVGELTGLPSIPAIAVTAGMSEVSYRLVENPIRLRTRLPVRALPVLGVGIAALVAVATVGPRPGIPIGRDRLAEAFDAVHAAVPVTGQVVVHLPIDGADSGSAGPGRLPPATAPLGDVSHEIVVHRRPRSITVVGDSTGVRLSEALAVWGEPLGISVDSVAMGGCSPAARDWDLLLGHPDLPAIPANDWCQPDRGPIGRAEVVIVSYQGLLALEHRRPGGEWTSIDREPDLAAAIELGLATAADAAAGAVLYLSIPTSLLPTASPESVAAANQSLRSVAARYERAAVVDSSIIDADPDRYPRSDRMHLDAEGVAAFVVDVLDSELVIVEHTTGRWQ